MTDGLTLAPPQVFYHGKLWDAPMTDLAEKMSDRLAKSVLTGNVPCDLCAEPLLYEQNILLLPYIGGHLECQIRSVMGNVQHLEGRCICNNGKDNPLPGEEEQSYREESLAAVEWLIKHGRGRFHDPANTQREESS